MSNWTEADFEAHQARVKRKPRKPDGKARLQALGRLPRGTMNKSEAAFAALLDRQKLAGEVLWYRFEGIKLMLAPNTSITVDFAVLPASGVLTMIDVKGARGIFTDDARAKMKVAAALYPFQFRVAYPRPRGEGWHFEDL